MGIFKKLSELFSPPRPEGAHMDWITVRCKRCGEEIQTRVDLRNDLSVHYGEEGETTYFCRKLLVGEQRCFQKIEVELTYDEKRNLIDRKIVGGDFVD